MHQEYTLRHRSACRMPAESGQEYLTSGKEHTDPRKTQSLQSCLTLCDPIDGSPPGSPIPGIHQARTLEWVAISFSNAWKWKVKVKLLSRVYPSATPWTAAHQAPPSMGFSRQEYWSGVPLPSPNDGISVCKYFSWIKGAELNPHFLYDFGTSISGHMTTYQEQTVV